ncbi:MAG: alpha/beta hydrolase [Pseudomonadota bacterium]
MMKRLAALIACATLASGACAAAPAKPPVPRVDTNVVYGMYSGLALLLDVYHPVKPNGFGVVFISGSGWQADQAYGAAPLKSQQIPLWGPPLLAAGYTVFAINHRAAPRFHYPAAIEDVQRAIRFVRHNSAAYGVDPAHLGGVGGSSGGHLLGLAAMLASSGDAAAADPVERESAALQAVVLRAPLLDLRTMGTIEGNALISSFMEAPPSNTSAAAAYAAASPITHVGGASPPVLLLHGDADVLVPIAQSEAMEQALKTANVPVRLVRIPGGVHGADFGAAQRRADWPDYYAETVRWLDQYLRGRVTADPAR